MKRLIAPLLLVLLLWTARAAAATLSLPAELAEIGEEAFFGDASLDRVVLPENVKRIGPRAFADSAVREITLPAGVEEIAEDAFDGSALVRVHAAADTYGYDWALRAGYIRPASEPSDFTCQEQEDGTLAITGYTGADTSVVVPQRIDGKEVRRIAQFAFSENQSITAVTLPDTVTDVENFAFLACDALKTIELPDHIESFERGYQFPSDFLYTCHWDSPTAHLLGQSGGRFVSPGWEDYALEWSDWDKYTGVRYEEQRLYLSHYTGTEANFVLPDWIDEVYSFAGNTSLETVTLHEGVSGIPSYCFEYCTALRSVEIPESVTFIGNHAFLDCSALERLVLPDNVDIHENSFAFPDKTELVCRYDSLTARSVSRDGNFTCLGDEDYVCRWQEGRLCLMQYRQHPRVFVMPDWIDELSNMLFEVLWYEADEGLEEVVLNDKITAIPFWCFRNCTSLRSITIPESVTVIGAGAFEDCTALENINIPDGVATIGAGAFRNTDIQSVRLPDHIQYLGEYYDNFAFPSATLLICGRDTQTARTAGKSFRSFAEPENLELQYRWGTLEEDEGMLYLARYTGDAVRFTVPDWVDALDSLCFADRRKLVSVVLPEHIFSFGSSCFSGCSSLESLNMPSGLKTILDEAFKDCHALLYLYLPQSVSYMSDDALDGSYFLATWVHENSYAQQWCDGKGRQYALMSPTSVGISFMPDVCRLYQTAYATVADQHGGMQPYSYRWELYRDEQLIQQTVWKSNAGGFSFKPTQEDAVYRVAVYMRDGRGTVCSASAVPNIVPYTQQELEEMAVRRELTRLLDSVPDPQSLKGIQFAESLPEYQWVINSAIDVLHLDFSILKTSANRLKFAYENALKYALSGVKTLKIAKMDALPASVKLIGNTITAGTSLYVDGLIDLCDGVLTAEGGVKTTDLERIFGSYADGSMQEGLLEHDLRDLGIREEELGTVMENMKWLKDLKTANTLISTYKKARKAINNGIELLNRMAMIDAMDSGALKAVADIYLAADSAEMNLAGQRLSALAYGTAEDRADLILSGMAAEIGIDALLDSVEFLSTAGSPTGAVVQLVYTGVDLFLGAGEYAARINEMTWSADICRQVYQAFLQARAVYRQNPSDDNYRQAFWTYILYLENAATVEECYVKVCDMQKDIPLLDTPEYVTRAAAQSADNAQALRDLIDEMKACDAFLQSGDYEQYRRTLAEIISRSAENFASGGGGGGTW